jgi:hypothetical protein
MVLRVTPGTQRHRGTEKWPQVYSRFHDDFFDSPDDAAVEHHLDAVRMRWRICQNSLNDSFRQFSCSLILLFDDADSHSWLNLRTRLSIHNYLDILMTSEYVRTSPAVNAFKRSGIELSNETERRVPLGEKFTATPLKTERMNAALVSTGSASTFL